MGHFMFTCYKISETSPNVEAHKWVIRKSTVSFYKLSNSRNKSGSLEVRVIIFLIQPIFISGWKMVLGPRRFFLKFMVGQLNRWAQPSLWYLPFSPYLSQFNFAFLLDFHYFNVLQGVSVPVTVRTHGSLVLWTSLIKSLYHASQAYFHQK